MIRFVASDLDGTLLQKDGTLPPNTFDIIRRLHDKGILFCAASGRQYANLHRLFSPVADDICFICENGSYVAAQGKTAAHTIPSSIALPLIRDILASGMELLLSIPESSILLSSASRSFTDDIFYRLRNTCSYVTDYGMYSHKYIKISGFHPDGVADIAPALQEKWSGHLHADIAGKCWLDFTMTNKSDGIRSLSEILHISTDDMAAFGDQHNDLAMLQCVGHPYLMKNAPDSMKQYSFSECENVLDTIWNDILNEK